MNVYLLNISLRGIKNIERLIELPLYDKSRWETINIRKHPVTAIYGPNGYGKTAILTGVQLAKNIITVDSYLKIRPQDYFDDLINKKTKEFFFSATLALFDEAHGNKTKAVYRYVLQIAKDQEEHSYKIKKESIYKVALRSREETFICGSENGVLSFAKPSSKKEESLEKAIVDSTRNLLSGTSFLRKVLLEALKMQQKGEGALDRTDWFGAIDSVFSAARQTEVSLRSEDIHASLYSPMSPTKQNETFSLMGAQAQQRDSNVTKVRKTDFKDYQNYIGKLTMFLEVFKPELQKIDVIKKEADKDSYYCTNVYVYPDYKITEEYESAGIKRLIRLFRYFQSASAGGIVFVDEIDAALSGVYLTRLIEFLCEYAKGQFIFTSHNTEPMEVLRSFSKSIYFLGADNQLTAWIRNGHLRPDKLYREGFIGNIPFNQDAIDFLPSLLSWEEDDA